MTSVRLATYYATSFMMLGVHLVFWPIWLTERGLNPPEIGTLLALGIASKLIANPIIAHFADQYGQRKKIIVILTVASFVSFSAFPFTVSFETILALHLLFLAMWSPTMPLIESLTMHGVALQGLDYGRIRLWGSVTFMAATIGVGYFLKGGSTDLIYAAISFTLGLTVVSAFFLPDLRLPKSIKKK
jgi:PPP family 3-phenylpropionic acid transporter